MSQSVGPGAILTHEAKTENTKQERFLKRPSVNLKVYERCPQNDGINLY